MRRAAPIILAGLLAAGLALGAASQPTHEELVGTSATLMSLATKHTFVETCNNGSASIWCSVGQNNADGGSDPYYPDAGQITVVSGCREVPPGTCWLWPTPASELVWCVASAAQAHLAGTCVTEGR